MKKKTNTSAAPSPLSADSAIQEVERRSRVPVPSKEALAELKKVIDHNDKQISMNKRVSYQTAIEILRAHGYATGLCFRTLNKICQEHLGRKGYTQP